MRLSIMSPGGAVRKGALATFLVICMTLLPATAAVSLEDPYPLATQWTVTAGAGAGQFGSGYVGAMSAGPDGRLYAVDPLNRRVNVYSSPGVFEKSFGSFSATPAPGKFLTLQDVDVYGGQVYALDGRGRRVEIFTPDGTYVREWSFSGTEMQSSMAVAGGFVYVLDGWGNKVRKFTLDGALVAEWGQKGSMPADFNGPLGIAADAANVYVVDGGNWGVKRFDTSGAFLGFWRSIPSLPTLMKFESVDVDSSGAVLVTAGEQVVKWTSSGLLLTNWATGLKTGGAPALDSAPDGGVYANRYSAKTIQRYAAPAFAADLAFRPEKLNLKSNGMATVYVEVPGKDVRLVDPVSVVAEVEGRKIGAKRVELESGDFDSDGVPDIAVKFDRRVLNPLVPVGASEFVLKVSGKAAWGKFVGESSVTVVAP